MVISKKEDKIVLNLTKSETSLVMWLNIVTIVAQSVRLWPAHMREAFSDDLVNAMPNMQKTLLQFATLAYIKLSAIYKQYLTETRN